MGGRLVKYEPLPAGSRPRNAFNSSRYKILARIAEAETIGWPLLAESFRRDLAVFDAERRGRK